MAQSREPARLGFSCARYATPPLWSRVAQIKAASDLSGADRVIIYSDGTVTDEHGELATSSTKTDPQSDSKAFVTLRFAGDDLDPAEIAAILPIAPTRAHRKGGTFFAGPRAGHLRGRTGIWFLSTDTHVASDDLGDHLEFVRDLLYPKPGDNSRIGALRDVLEHAQSRARLTCFWRGDPGEAEPPVPAEFRSAIAPLGSDIETDFAVSEIAQ